MDNLKTGTKGLSENMQAAQKNILLRGYFNKKKKAEARQAAALKKQAEIKRKNDLKNAGKKGTPNVADSTKK
jgi:phospholipid/cholesterol/gamma-HCH transport system substrate-binding protein